MYGSQVKTAKGSEKAKKITKNAKFTKQKLNFTDGKNVNLSKPLNFLRPEVLNSPNIKFSNSN